LFSSRINIIIAKDHILLLNDKLFFKNCNTQAKFNFLLLKMVPKNVSLFCQLNSFLCAALHTVNALLSSFPAGFHRFPAFPPPGQPLSAREAAGRLLLLCVAVRERQLEDATGSRGVQRGNRPAHDKGH